MIRYFFEGLGAPDTALAVSRVAAGLFFLLSGYHKPFNADRRATLVLTLQGVVCGMSTFSSGFCPLRNFRVG